MRKAFTVLYIIFCTVFIFGMGFMCAGDCNSNARLCAQYVKELFK